MDPRLLEAAQSGSVDELNDLIRSNALILEEMALQGAGHTPLHISCVTCHLNFVPGAPQVDTAERCEIHYPMQLFPEDSETTASQEKQNLILDAAK